MTADVVSAIGRIFQQERINFLLTNRIPRRWATLFMGWFSRIESPILTRVCLAVWQLFAGPIDLGEARKSEFKSLHECFIRELAPGARLIDDDPGIIISPCDGIVGAFGPIEGQRIFQAKGYPYTLTDLLTDPRLVERYRDGFYVTLRLRSTMYHRFHAPHDGVVSNVTYISGDTWNVNPIALERVERLFCKNERAVIELNLDHSRSVLTLVPIAAILVAGIKLGFLDEVLDLGYAGPNIIRCHARFRKGEELGYFQHGSTIIVFATAEHGICETLSEGSVVRMGEPLLHLSRPHQSTRVQRSTL